MEPWRLTRTPTARRLYEWLADHGVRVATMVRYTHEGDPPEQSLPAAVTVARWAGDPSTLPDVGADAAAGPGTALADLGERDLGLVARDGDAYAGHVLLSDRPVEVHPLEAAVDVPGAYLHRLFVHPDHRGRGLASALVCWGMRAASEAFGTDRTDALVATDNRPSRATFESVGFGARERLDYLRLRSRTWRRRRPVA